MMRLGLAKNSLILQHSLLELEEVIFWLRVCPGVKMEGEFCLLNSVLIPGLPEKLIIQKKNI